MPQLVDLTPYGTFVQSGDNYTLDLGAVLFGQRLPTLQFGIENAATTPADDLSGTISAAPVEGFTISGATLPGALSPGQSYDGISASINTIKFGQNVETITFSPVDTNASGFSAPLPDITLTIADTLELPSLTYSQAWGDVHIVTYNGTMYNFQGAGEYWLAQSKIAGDTFGIQLRLQPWSPTASVTVITEVAVSLGTDRVTFAQDRPDVVWVDGTPSTLDAANQTLTLAGGTITELSPSMFRVNWATGETMTVTDAGSYMNVVDGIPAGDLAGGIAGLQGEAEGQPNDFQLPDGTILPQPLTSDELYNVYGNSWRVSQATSLFDYGPGQSTSTFTNTGFPFDPLTLADLPANMVAAAANLVAAAGITDPGIAQAAELDYLATGDPSFLNAALNIQQDAVQTTPATVTPSAAPVPEIGVEATAQKIVESGTGTTTVGFTAYLTTAVATDTVVDYTVAVPGAGYVDSSAFGGTLPTGTVTIAAGQTSAPFSIVLPEGAVSAASAILQVQVSDQAAVPVFAPTAQTEIDNNQPVAGSPALPQIAYLGGPGTFSFDATTNTYTLDLASVVDQAIPPLKFAVTNAATAPADSLGGSFTPPAGSGFLVSGAALPGPLTAGETYQGLTFTATSTTSPGSNTETIVFRPTDQNASGFSAALPALTLTVTDPVLAPAQMRLNTPDTIIFPNVRVGSADNQAVSVTNIASPPSAGLDVLPLPSGDAIAVGTVSSLAAGATDASDLSVGLDTSASGGRSGAVELASFSDPGNSTTTPLPPSQTIDLFGSVYRPGAPGTIAPISEIVHVDDPGTAALTINNTDPADTFSEDLIATLTGTTGGIGIASGGPTPEIAAGGGNASLAVGFATKQAGTVSGTATVRLTSDGGTGTNSIDGLGQIALAAQTVPVTITVDNYAAPALQEVSGGGTWSQNGTGYTLDLGDIPLGTSLTPIQFAVLNAALAPADDLSGGFTETGPDSITGFGTFSGLAAGGSQSAGTVTVDTSVLGGFTETITLDPTDSNTSGFSQSLAPVTLTIEGTITQSLGQVFLLTRGPDTVNGGSGDNTILAGSGTLSPGDEIDGGSGTNTLALTSPGTFDFRAPTAITNIATITATEGQPAFVGSGAAFSAENQLVVLRDGLDALVQVSAAASVNAANPRAPTITISGAHNADVINLASGNDVVIIGDARETVHGGTGNDTIHVTAATIGAAIDGGTGQSILNVTGGGTVVMGSSVTNIATVLLSPAANAYDFTANAIGGLTVDDTNTGADVLRAGAADQTITGGSGDVTMVGSSLGADVFRNPAAAFNGDTIEGFAAPNSVIDFTDIDFATLARPGWQQSSPTAGSLSVTDGTRSATVALFGQFAAAGFQALPDSGTGTEIVYQPQQTQTPLATPH